MSDGQEKMVPAPAQIPQGVVKSTPQAQVFTGGVATGKTQALVERVAALVEGGVLPAQILALCATPDAAAKFSQRLASRCPEAAAVRATTVREACLMLTGTPEAQAATGRDARLLAPFERDFLLEDLKTSGMLPKRIKEMMKFFFRSMTELCDLEEGWLITNEEEAMFGLLKNCLAFERGIIEPELANLVAAWLLDDADACADAAYAHVVADDYQMMSRASQVVANLLARDSIAIACDPQACLEVFDSYPYANGMAEFCEANPHAVVESLSQSHACAPAVRATNVMRADLAIAAEPLELPDGSDPDETQVIEVPTPADEINAVADAISALVESGIAADDIVVASPHRLWARNLSRALAASGIDAEMAGSSRAVSGDVRILDKCAAARVLTGLYLVADVTDCVAWRSWCGFGDWLANSNALLGLREYGGMTSQALDAVLENAGLESDSFEFVESPAELQRVAEAHHAGMALIEQGYDLEGVHLLEFLSRTILGEDAQVPQVIVDLATGEDGLQGNAATLAARIRQRLNAPAFQKAGCVRMVPYEGIVGMNPDVLVMCGFVNGFFPSRDYFDRTVMSPEQAEVVHEHDARLMALVVGKPTKKLIVSYFDYVGLEQAERLGLKIKRIRLKDKKRVALTEPSEYLHRIEGRRVHD